MKLINFFLLIVSVSMLFLLYSYFSDIKKNPALISCQQELNRQAQNFNEDFYKERSEYRSRLDDVEKSLNSYGLLKKIYD